MAKTKLEHLRLGIFVILGIILLLFAAYLIGNRQNMFSKTFEISAVFKNATGLQNGNNVRFSGINVGTVNSVEMINDTTIRVRMIIQDEMRNHIKKNAIASIGTNGLVGSMLINIVPGSGKGSLITPGDELQSSNKIGTQDMMSTLNVTNENAALLTADLLKVTQALNQGKGTLGRLLNDTVMSNDLQKTILNLKNASNSANVTMIEMNKMVEQLDFEESAAGVLLSDTISGGKIKNVIEHLETTSIEIEKMAQNLNSIIGGINEGNGAINYLTKDSIFVNQLERSIENIEQGTERFNENMEALKHNFLTRGYFRKLEKKEKKNSN
ncbi:phospholipid/cholesterol/gamma-HCH transport system substrate-binding protein [Maribacter orientalis]|uniref:Phospholipid/cholesterol/gamma-HCH transport system substrate-binding protein n=1 Tax=Maribacter orientalis TaxID=228957 RepID=A0A1H7FG97_9FLAO|nr:MlaD family protein [Maribacter orientalis]SEK24979.1 phospholipid/cholesterol/gamma-HCH transport system substrate-binding protein [Maribacter orientalis]